MPKCPTCGGHVDWIEIENERLGTSCRVADDCPRCMPHWIELPDPAPHPTSPSPDPVVQRLERELEEAKHLLADKFGFSTFLALRDMYDKAKSNEECAEILRLYCKDGEGFWRKAGRRPWQTT